MNLHTNKRSSSDDINERRKRRRTISNDLYRGFNVENEKSISDTSSSISSDSEIEDDLQPDSNVPNASSSSHCNRCSKCKCDEVPKLLEVHNEVLSLLTEMKKKNNEIHKSVMLELQICRQEIIQEVQQLRQSFTRMTDLMRRNNNSNNNNNHNNQNLHMFEYMDDETEEASDSDNSQDDDFAEDFLR